jgi:hypothetical protein
MRFLQVKAISFASSSILCFIISAYFLDRKALDTLAARLMFNLVLT